MKMSVFALFIQLGLTVAFVQSASGTMIDVLPGTPADDSGVRVESYLSMGNDEWRTDLTEENWAEHGIVGMGNNSLNFYFADLTDYIHLNVYTLGDTLVTAGGYFRFAAYDPDGSLLQSQGLGIRFGQLRGVEFTSLAPLISRLEVRFQDPDAGGFVQSLSYNTVETPEPTTVVLLGAGVLMLIGQALRRGRLM